MYIRFSGWALWILLLGCTKITQTNPYSGNNSNIVVEGGLNTFTNLQSLRITQVSTSTLAHIDPVSHLNIQVKGGGQILNFTESNVPGVYNCILDHKLSLNQRYTLSAISTDNSQEIYALDTLNKVSPIPGTLIPFTTTLLKNGNVELQIPKHIFGQKSCLKWLIVPKSDTLWSPLDFRNNFTFTYEHQLGVPNVLYSLNGINMLKDFDANDSVLVYKFSSSSTHGIYLYGVFEETEWKGLFSGAPSQVIGNINLNGQGFFSTTDITTKTYCLKDLVGKKIFF